MGWPLLLFLSIKFSEIFVTIVLFTGYIYIFSNLTNLWELKTCSATRSQEKQLRESYDPAKYNWIQLFLEFYSFTSNKNFRNYVFFSYLGRNMHSALYGARIRQMNQLL